MPSRNRHLTFEEKKQNFERNLKAAIEIGSYPNSGDGLPTNAFETITKIADAYPESKPDLVKLARQDWAEYADWRRQMRTRRN